MESNYSINVIYDAEAKVFVGTSTDIPGLTIEEDSVHQFLDSAMEIVPYLLEENLRISGTKHEAVSVNIQVEEPPKLKEQVKPIFHLRTYSDSVYRITPRKQIDNDATFRNKL